MIVDARSMLAEGIGTAILLATIVGSGHAVERLGAAPAEQLFIHAVVVGLALGVAIAVFLPVSGAHFNPVVSLAFVIRGEMAMRPAAEMITAQIIGGICGVAIANLTFSGAAFEMARLARDGSGRFGGEMFATFGLVLVILVLVETDRLGMIPVSVGAWVATIIVATASTGFANPVVTVVRMFTDSFTGIQPSSVPSFIGAQLLGALMAVLVTRILFPAVPIHDV